MNHDSTLLTYFLKLQFRKYKYVSDTLVTIVFDHRSESMIDTKYDIAIGYTEFMQRKAPQKCFITSLKYGQNCVH